MLLTERQLSRRKSLVFPQPERVAKVRKSMGAIKHVLGERKRAHLTRLKAAAADAAAADPQPQPPPPPDEPQAPLPVAQQQQQQTSTVEN